MKMSRWRETNEESAKKTDFLAAQLSVLQFNKLCEMLSDWIYHNWISFQAEASFKSSIKKSKENFSISELFSLCWKLNFLCACFTCKFYETKIHYDRSNQEANENCENIFCEIGFEWKETQKDARLLYNCPQRVFSIWELLSERKRRLKDKKLL